MARRVIFNKIGGPEVLEVVDRDVPAPKTGEVQLRVKAMGLKIKIYFDSKFHHDAEIEKTSCVASRLALRTFVRYKENQPMLTRRLVKGM